MLAEQGIMLDAMRVKAFPFTDAVKQFIESHERVYVVEQNRDAQFKSLLVNELGIYPQDLVSILNYDGFPITADVIRQKIFKSLIGRLNNVARLIEIAPPEHSDVEE